MRQGKVRIGAKRPGRQGSDGAAVNTLMATFDAGRPARPPVRD